MARSSRTFYAEAVLSSVLLIAVVSAGACSEEGLTPKCNEQPRYNIAKEYDGSGEPGGPDAAAARARAEDAGCMTPVGHATSAGGASQQVTGGTGGVSGTGGSAGASGNGAGGTAGSAGAGAGNGGSAGAAGAAGSGGLGIGGSGLAGLAGVAGG